MNIVEAYIKINKQLVILVSGLSSSGKTELSKNIERDFKIKRINANEFCVPGNIKKTVLSNGIEVNNCDVDDIINWEELNAAIDGAKGSGVIISGYAFPSEFIKTHIDFHIHISISMTTCIDRRREYLKEHPDKYLSEQKLVENGTDEIKMREITYPYYKKTVERSSINKFINGNKMSTDEIYDKAFEEIVTFIKRVLKQE